MTIEYETYIKTLPDGGKNVVRHFTVGDPAILLYGVMLAKIYQVFVDVAQHRHSDIVGHHREDDIRISNGLGGFLSHLADSNARPNDGQSTESTHFYTNLRRQFHPCLCHLRRYPRYYM